MEETKDPKEYSPKEIEKALRDNMTVTPDVLARWRTRMSAEWAYYAGEMENIEKSKAKIWLEIKARIDVKSDAQTDRIFATTEMGQNEIGLKWRLKGLEKQISSLRQEVDTAQTAWNMAT